MTERTLSLYHPPLSLFLSRYSEKKNVTTITAVGVLMRATVKSNEIRVMRRSAVNLRCSRDRTYYHNDQNFDIVRANYISRPRLSNKFGA